METHTNMFGNPVRSAALLQKDHAVNASLALRAFSLMDSFPWVSREGDNALIGSAYGTALACVRIHHISEEDSVKLTNKILERMGYILVKPMTATELWGFLRYTPISMECYTDYSKFELLFREYAEDLKRVIAWMK